MGKKLNLNEVKIGFENKGWILTSSSYVNSQQKLNVICPVGHETTITWNNFQRGQGCKYCANNIKFDFEFVKKEFEKRNCVLLSTEYKSNNHPLDYICSCGNTSKISFSHFKNGTSCKKCSVLKAAEKLKTPVEEIEQFCETNGCKLLEVFKENDRSHIKYICKCGSSTRAVLSNFKRFPNCWECGVAKKRGDKCHLWNPDRDYIDKAKKFRKKCNNMLHRIIKKMNNVKCDKSHNLLGYTTTEFKEHIENLIKEKGLEGKSIHIDHKFPVQAFFDHGIKSIKLINCLENLEPLLDIDNLSKGSQYNKQEFLNWIKQKNICNSIFHWLKENNINFDIENNDFVKLNNISIKIIDIKTPYKKNKYKHYENGHQNILIFSDEWDFRKEQCCNHIKSLINKNEKIHGRKCYIKELNKKDAKKFIEKYHIQGSNNLGLIYYGLFLKDNLLGVMSLGRHNRNYPDKLILDRLCFKDGYSVAGGASKLFKKCIEWAKVNNYKKIISYSDNRWSLGKVYEKLNFKLDKELYRDYCYFKNGDIKRTKKQNLRKSITGCPKNKTESIWAKENGYNKLWDCGKKRWIYDL